VKDVICRPIEDGDLLEVSEWYTHRKWRVPPNANILPKSAYVAEKEGQLLSIIWLYVTNSGIGIIDWVATNPHSGTLGIRSLKKVLKYAEDIVGNDLNTFIHFTHNDKLSRFFSRKCGFKEDGKVNINIKVFNRAEA
jgi:hypothetical protein